MKLLKSVKYWLHFHLLSLHASFPRSGNAVVIIFTFTIFFFISLPYFSFFWSSQVRNKNAKNLNWNRWLQIWLWWLGSPRLVRNQSQRWLLFRRNSNKSTNEISFLMHCETKPNKNMYYYAFMQMPRYIYIVCGELCLCFSLLKMHTKKEQPQTINSDV